MKTPHFIDHWLMINENLQNERIEVFIGFLFEVFAQKPLV